MADVRTPRQIARVVRYELPGRRWYAAHCHACQWVGRDWKDKAWAAGDRDCHNKEKH